MTRRECYFDFFKMRPYRREGAVLPHVTGLEPTRRYWVLLSTERVLDALTGETFAVEALESDLGEFLYAGWYDKPKVMIWPEQLQLGPKRYSGDRDAPLVLDVPPNIPCGLWFDQVGIHELAELEASWEARYIQSARPHPHRYGNGPQWPSELYPPEEDDLAAINRRPQPIRRARLRAP